MVTRKAKKPKRAPVKPEIQPYQMSVMTVNYWFGRVHLHLVSPSISDPALNSRVGRLLYNTETKQICFGLEDSNSGMVALTVTDKGTFWNGHLKIIKSVETAKEM